MAQLWKNLNAPIAEFRPSLDVTQVELERKEFLAFFPGAQLRLRSRRVGRSFTRLVAFHLLLVPAAMCSQGGSDHLNWDQPNR
jgi:hypothetical protein